MSNLVTFSSEAFQNDDQTTTERFTSFSLDGGDAQVLESIRNRITSGRPAGLSFAGPNLIDRIGDLEAVEARGVTGPRGNMAGEREAVIMEGELVTVTYTLSDGVGISGKGIVTDLAFRVGSGGKLVQAVDLVFHRIDHLLFHNSSLILHASAA